MVLQVLCFSIMYALVQTATKYMTPWHEHLLNKQDSPLSRTQCVNLLLRINRFSSRDILALTFELTDREDTGLSGLQKMGAYQY